MEEVLKIILATIGAAGGTGAIIFLALKFSINKLSERMSQKYQLKLDKEFEKYKNELEIETRKLSSKLENKNHISKALFDIQPDFYKQLSDTFFNVVLCANTLIPSGVYNVSKDKNLQKKER